MTVTPGAINRLLVAGLLAVVGLAGLVEIIGEERLLVLYGIVSVTYQQNLPHWYLVGLLGAAACIACVLYAGDRSARPEKMHWMLIACVGLFLAAEEFAGLGSVVMTLIEIPVRRDVLETMALIRPVELLLCVVTLAGILVAVAGPFCRAIVSWTGTPEPGRSLTALALVLLCVAPPLDDPLLAHWTGALFEGAAETGDLVPVALEIADTAVKIVAASLLLVALFSELPRHGQHLQIDIGPLRENRA